MHRRFHITDILSITTGRLVSSRGTEGVNDILEYMTGTPIFEHQVSKARETCAPVLLAEYPYLAEVNCQGVDEDNFAERMIIWINLFGEHLSVPKLSDSLPDFAAHDDDGGIEIVHTSRTSQPAYKF